MEHSRTVLVVDDDYDIRLSVSDALEMEGYDVWVAANGAEALDRLRRAAKSPCVILLDLMMPTLDGAGFRAVQRGDPAMSTIPVVILSANNRVQHKAAELGTAGYIGKPFRLDELLATVGRFCNGGRAARSE